MFSFTELADFFLPRNCVSCLEKLSGKEKYFCHSCSGKLILTDNSFIQSEFNRKFSGDGIISKLLSLYIFETDSPVQSIIHHLKYSKRFKAGIFLGEKIAERFKNDLNGIDIFIPVPLHPAKEAERGFNQSYFLARGIAQRLNKEIGKRVIKRVRNTKSQTMLSLDERAENMRGAFVLSNPEIIRNKSVAMVDDVITTGSTIKECAALLKQNGARIIIAVSSAITNI